MARKRIPVKRRRATKPRSVSYVVTKGGPLLFDLRVPVERVRLLVNGPGMLFDRFELVTSLDASEGATSAALVRLSKAIRVTAICGHRPPVRVKPQVVLSRIGARLLVGVGPMGMYQSEVILDTPRRTFRRLLDETLARHRRRSYQAALTPVAGTGHHEHHGAANAGDGGHQHGG